MVKINRAIILFSILFIGVVYASDEVYLELDTLGVNRFNTGKLQYENPKTDADEDENYLKPSFYNLKKMFDEDFAKSKEQKAD